MVPAAHRLQGTTVRVSQAGPPQGLLQPVSWGRRCTSALPPWPEKPFLEVIPRAEEPPAAQNEHFHFPEGYLHPAREDVLQWPTTWVWWCFDFPSSLLCSQQHPFTASSLNKNTFMLFSSRNEGGKQVTTMEGKTAPKGKQQTCKTSKKLMMGWVGLCSTPQGR